MVIFFQCLLVYRKGQQTGVMTSTDLEGGFGLDKPLGYGVSQAAELLRFQLKNWLPRWKDGS